MIKRLRIKFVCIMMGVLLLVFAVVVATLNFFMQAQSDSMAKDILQSVVAQDGLMFNDKRFGDGTPDATWPEQEPKQPLVPTQMMRASRIFYVKLDHNGNALEVRHDMMFDFTREEALAYAEAVVNGKASGTYDNYRYLVADKPYGTIIAFVENSRDNLWLRQLIDVSLWVAGATCVVLLVFAILLSRWVVKPVKETLDKQRQFVSDASHELKTPLTIIAANVDVLEHEIGENTRLSQMREQAARMNQLVYDLLSLARAEEDSHKPVAASFDISKAVLGTVLAFESRAFEEGKWLEVTIEPDLHRIGVEAHIKQITAILVDNAIRHSNNGGEIRVGLTRKNDKVKLTVYNTGIGIPDREHDLIFERFYRSDESRSTSTGGYGLGLAIAKSLVEQHRGKLSVSGKEGAWVQFTALL